MGGETLGGGGGERGLRKFNKIYYGLKKGLKKIKKGDWRCFTMFSPKSSDSSPHSPVISNDWSLITCIALPHDLKL